MVKSVCAQELRARVGLAASAGRRSTGDRKVEGPKCQPTTALGLPAQGLGGTRAAHSRVCPADGQRLQEASPEQGPCSHAPVRTHFCRMPFVQGGFCSEE